MVLAELGQRISRALGSLNSVTVVDEAVRAARRRRPARPLAATCLVVATCRCMLRHVACMRRLHMLHDCQLEGLQTALAPALVRSCAVPTHPPASKRLQLASFLPFPTAAHCRRGRSCCRPRCPPPLPCCNLKLMDGCLGVNCRH